MAADVTPDERLAITDGLNASADVAYLFCVFCCTPGVVVLEVPTEDGRK